MPRCCQGGTCACLIEVSDKLRITGVGSAQQPYIIGLDVQLEVASNTVFDLSLVGAGDTEAPWTLSVEFADTASIDDLPDVDTTGKTNGDVFGWNDITGQWEAQAPTTAAAGSVSTDASLDGDGSVGDPLAVAHDPDGFTETTGTGIAISTAGQAQMVLHFADAATRDALLPTPDLNQTVMLDDEPGIQWYWTGSQWNVVTNGVSKDFGSEFLAMSGSYVAGLPVTLITRQISVTTDALGVFDVVDALDLTGFSGVLTCHFQESGIVGYKAVMFGNIDHVSAVAYRLDDGTPLASQAIEGMVTAYVY
jgi:hypothetical protein